MNNRLNLPEEIEPGRHYSFRADIKVNGWAYAAAVTSFVGELSLLPQHKEWPTTLRAVIAFAPLGASLLWVRSVIQWMRGMDELQRRITTASSVFATTTTLFLVATSHLLVVAGVLPIRFQATAGFVIIWLVVCFYIVGRAFFNRRYQ